MQHSPTLETKHLPRCFADTDNRKPSGTSQSSENPHEIADLNSREANTNNPNALQIGATEKIKILKTLLAENPVHNTPSSCFERIAIHG